MLVGGIIFVLCWIAGNKFASRPRTPKYIREQIERNRWS